MKQGVLKIEMEPVAQPTSKVRYPGYIRHKRYYTEIFPGTAILTLSIIQILMAAASITAQAFGQHSEGSSSNYGAGIWCGIVFGLSGVFGIIAWKNPTFSTILVYKIFNILSMIFCLPLITTSFLFAMAFPYNAILLAVGVIQIIVVIIGFTMITKVLCLPCDTYDDDEALGYKKSTANDGSHVEMQQLVSSQA